MTLGGGGRGPGGRRSFPGAGRDDRRVGDAPKPWERDPAPWGGAEIEELPPQPVVARGRARPGLSAALGAGVVVLILAGGLGVLGGRSGPASSAVAKASESPSAEPSEPVLPEVTPAEPCLPLTAGELPEVRLAYPSGGGLYAGMVSILEWNQPGAAPTPPALPENQLRTPSIVPFGAGAMERIPIRADAVADLRTTGNPCATAWSISADVSDHEIDLEQFASREDNPESARQNRFSLVLAPFRGREFNLTAMLQFPGVTTRTTWPIAVLPFEAPTATLTRGKRSVEVVDGCNLQLSLENGYAEPVNACSEDVPRLPEIARLLVPGQPLVFRFPNNWYVQGASITCGSFEALRFQPDPSGACTVGWGEDGIALTIDVPSVDGTWTLAIETCATELLSDATNQVCGTWYARIQARSR